MQELSFTAVLIVCAIYVVPGTFIASVALTSIIRRVAPRIGLMDCPDGHRKLHAGRTPLGGGIAVFLATSCVLLGLVTASTPWANELRADARQQLALLLAGALVVGLGLIDDWTDMRGRHKLLGQVVCATIMVMGGLAIRRIEVLGWSVEFGVFAFPLTILWIVGAINAVNLLDGIDGLAGTIGVVLSVTIGILAAVTGNFAVTVVAWAFASALSGFLVFNLPPASVFLGDAGSMLIGLVVGTLAVRGSLVGSGTALLAAPLAIWSIPALDTLAAILRRKLTGRSIYATDRGHLHHCTMAMLGTNQRALAVLTICCAVTCIAGLASIFESDDRIALVTCGGIALVLVATGLFGRTEASLIVSHLHSAASSLWRCCVTGQRGPRAAMNQFYGPNRWAPWWDLLTARGDELNVGRMCLDLDMPATNERLHATWQRASADELQSCWHVDLPLEAAGRRVGRLTLAGRSRRHMLTRDLDRLLEVLLQFEMDVIGPGTAGPSADERPEAHANHDTDCLIHAHPK